MAIVNIPGFNGGEVSPSMYSRVDNNAYPMSCKRLINFIPLQTGPAKRRSGFVLVNKAGSDDRPVRLIPFVFSTGQSYCLEFGERVEGEDLIRYMRVHRGGGTILNTDGTVYEVPTEIPANVAVEMQYAQSADMVILVHESMPPLRIGRYDELDWRVEKMLFVPSLVLSEAPTIEPRGTGTGTQTYEYAVTAVLPGGMETQISLSDSIDNRPMSLTFENYNVISYQPVSENVEYLKVYRKRNGMWGYVGRASTGALQIDWIDAETLYDGRVIMIGKQGQQGYFTIRSASGVYGAISPMPFIANSVSYVSGGNVLAVGDKGQYAIWKEATGWGAIKIHPRVPDVGQGGVHIPGGIPNLMDSVYTSANATVVVGQHGVISTYNSANETLVMRYHYASHHQYSCSQGVSSNLVVVGGRTSGVMEFNTSTNQRTRTWVLDGYFPYDVTSICNTSAGDIVAITNGAREKVAGLSGAIYWYIPSSNKWIKASQDYYGNLAALVSSWGEWHTCIQQTGNNVILAGTGGLIATRAGESIYIRNEVHPTHFSSGEGYLWRQSTFKAGTQLTATTALLLGLNNREMIVTSTEYDDPWGEITDVQSSGYVFIDDGTYGPDISHGPPVYENDFTVDFPRTVTYHDNRLIFGGTASQPNTLYGSELGIFNSFATFQTPTAATPFIFQLRSDQINTIQWMRSVGGRLQVGTSGGEWALRNLRADQVWEGGRSSQVGSKYLEALALDSGTLYVDRIGKTVRTFLYEVQRGDFVSYDLTIYADHLLDERAIVAWTYATTPYAQVWCVCDDGIALCMTYNNAQGVIAWGRMITDGKIKGICAIPTTDEDEVYIVVERGGKQYVEVMAKDFRGDVQSMVFLDAAVRYDLEEPATEFDGLEHLEGREISICADGATMPSQTVVDGKITLPHPATRVVAGLPYISTLETTEIEGGSNSVSQSRQRRIGMITTKLIESVGGKIGVGTNDMNVDADSSLRLEPIRYTEQPARNSTMPMSRPVRLFTGYMEITPESGYSNSPSIVIEQDAPQPLTVAAFYPRMDEHGR